MRDEELLPILQMVSTMSDASVSNGVRLQAYQACEDLKKTLAPIQKIELGFTLARNDPRWNFAVIHFGMQLIEDVIKYSWPSFTVEQKIAIRDIAVQLVAAATSSGDPRELSNIDGSAKLVVEIIKREWPQQWPNMLPELEALSQQGPAQLQVVILVFLRLVEDLMQFKQLSAVRQRELTKGITSAMPDLISFLVRSLEQNIPTASRNILRLFSALGESAQVKFLWEKNGILFDTLLFRTVDDESLRLEIADFLFCMLSRKYTKKEDVDLVLRLFSEEKYFLKLMGILDFHEKNIFIEKTYSIFKKFCQVFTGLAQLLVQVVNIPAYLVANAAHFREYVKKLTALTDHESVVISDITLNGWLAFWGNKAMKLQPEVLSKAVILLRTCGRLSLLQKSKQHRWMEMDFLHPETAFRDFLINLRMKISELIRRISSEVPKETLEYSFGAVTAFIQRKETDQNNWSAILTVLDGCVRGLPSDMKVEFRERAFHILNQLIAMEALVP